MTNTDIVDASRALIEDFSRAGYATLHVRSLDFELLLSNDPTATISSATYATNGPVGETMRAVDTTAAASAAKPTGPTGPTVLSASIDLPEDAVIIPAPNLGTFYRAPKPGAAFYVEVGGLVEVNQEICLLEVMKLFTAVRSKHAGRIHAVLAEDGAMVEAGQPLFALVAN